MMISECRSPLRDVARSQAHIAHLALQFRHRRRTGQVGLAGTGRADRENDVIIAHRLNVFCLTDCFRLDDFFQSAGEQSFGGNLFGRSPSVFTHHGNGIIKILFSYQIAEFNAGREVPQQPGYQAHFIRITFQGDPITARDYFYEKTGFNDPQENIVLAKQEALVNTLAIKSS